MNHQGRQQSLEFLFDFFFFSQSQHRLIDKVLPESPIDERIVLKDFLVVIIVPDGQGDILEDSVESLENVRYGLATFVKQVSDFLCVVLTH